MLNKAKLKFFQPSLFVKNKIAIVGSSSSILKKKNGSHIDTFEEVIRFNIAETENYKLYVGNKTTLRIVNNNVFFRLPETGHEFFLKNLEPCNLGIIAPFKINKNQRDKFSLDNHNYFFFNILKAKIIILTYFLIFPKIFFKLFKLVKMRKQFSIGFITILTVVVSGKKPTLFGFDLNEDMTKRSHYYIKNWPIGGRHDFMQEHEIIKDLLKKNLIFYEI